MVTIARIISGGGGEAFLDYREALSAARRKLDGLCVITKIEAVG
jgi:hypothetical protein